MLDYSHMVPLRDYAARLRQRPDVEVPDFDSFDGGINARILFLFEKPGPMTADAGRGRRAGSGFISRNNDDPTANAIFEFMDGIPRLETVCWNIIPWWNGTIKTTGPEFRDGVREAETLLGLLKKVSTVVLVGRRARQAERHLRPARPDLEFFTSYHPARRVKNVYREQWNEIPVIWRSAHQFVSEERALRLTVPRE